MLPRSGWGKIYQRYGRCAVLATGHKESFCGIDRTRPKATPITVTATATGRSYLACLHSAADGIKHTIFFQSLHKLKRHLLTADTGRHRLLLSRPQEHIRSDGDCAPALG
jgi:hypothetical protein